MTTPTDSIESLDVPEPCLRNQVGNDSGPHFFKHSAFLVDGRHCVYCGTKPAVSS
ncbi:hypothetical protein OG285_32695 [Streptomyces sp. NBC_01471]|uniref:hypothetical protein n=1 Tax=Streptomyces sp. NBC_01471 TaxID=2903879 RepID=UPI003246E89C